MRGSVCFFFNDTATTEIYTYCTLSLHDARPIFAGRRQCRSLSVPQTVGHAVKLGHRVAGDERQQLRATEIELDVIFEAETIATERAHGMRSEEHTSELQSLMRISYAVFCLKKKHANEELPCMAATPTPYR